MFLRSTEKALLRNTQQAAYLFLPSPTFNKTARCCFLLSLFPKNENYHINSVLIVEQSVIFFFKGRERKTLLGAKKEKNNTRVKPKFKDRWGYDANNTTTFVLSLFFFFFSVYVCISELLVSYGRLFDLLREVAIVFVRLLQLFFFVCVCAFVVPS